MTSIILLSNTQGKFEITGDACRVDQWLPHNGGWYTMSITVDNFQGRVWLEASLSTTPQEGDWFPIWLQSKQPFLSYPLNPHQQTGMSGGDSNTTAYRFQANILWIRARLDRSHLTQPSIGLESLGVIKQIIVSI
jgi:hypothetical protein